MANLLGSLTATAGALDAFSQVLQVTANNVANASTPGWAKQTLPLVSVASAMNSALGYSGGVGTGQIESSRDEYAEQQVQQQTSQFGRAQQDVSSLTAAQSLFDISGDSGISGAFNNLFQSFSAWAQTPSSTVARQTVLQRATDVATAFQQTASGLAQLAQNTSQQLNQTVSDVNGLSSTLASYNRRILSGDVKDPGLDAQIHSTLEQLSQYAGITATEQSDGSYTVLLNGETTMVNEGQSYELHVAPEPPDPAAKYPRGPGHLTLLMSDGSDVTSNTTAGQLGSLLNTYNTVLPSYLGDTSQPGDLNTLALDFATHVNDLLKKGYQTDGANPLPGVPLFTFDTSNDTNVAKSLKVDPTVTPNQLAAITLGPPEVSNGVALALAQLANPTSTNDEIGGVSYTQYYGNLAANVGSLLSNATNVQQVEQSAVAQAQNVRQQVSGVSLDEEAAILVQFQRAYEANSKLLTVLDQLMQDTIAIIPS